MQQEMPVDYLQYVVYQLVLSVCCTIILHGCTVSIVLFVSIICAVPGTSLTDGAAQCLKHDGCAPRMAMPNQDSTSLDKLCGYFALALTSCAGILCTTAILSAVYCTSVLHNSRRSCAAIDSKWYRTRWEASCTPANCLCVSHIDNLRAGSLIHTPMCGLFLRSRRLFYLY